MGYQSSKLYMVDVKDFPLMDYNHTKTQQRRIELIEKYDEIDGRRIRIRDTAIVDDEVEVGDTLVNTRVGEYKINNHVNPEEYDEYYRVVEVCPDLVEGYTIYYINLHITDNKFSIAEVADR